MKKFISLLLALALVSSLSITAFARETETGAVSESWETLDIDEEIDRALNGVTDVTIPADMQGVASAYVADVDGNKLDVPVDVYVTTRKLETPKSGLEKAGVDVQEEVVYATTAVAVMATDKMDTSTGRKANVRGSLSILWTDVFGVQNNFRGLSGGWTIDSGTTATLSNRMFSLKGTGPTAAEGPVLKFQGFIEDTFNLGPGSYENGWTSYLGHSEVLVGGAGWLVLNVSTGQISIG